jgi:hypothetical protein
METSVSELRDALKVRLATIAGLGSYDTVPDKPEPPCAIVGFPTIDYDSTFARGADRHVYPVVILASTSVDQAAQDTLDRYIKGHGATSIKRAIEQDPQLGNKAQTCRVLRCRDYGPAVWNEVLYLSATLDVEVIV